MNKLLGNGGLLGSDNPDQQSARMDSSEKGALGHRSLTRRTASQGSSTSGTTGAGKAQPRGQYDGRGKLGRDEP